MSQYIEEKDFDKNLRLGDVIKGFSHILPTFDDFINNGNEFKLEIKPQDFFAILTPCCSIEEKFVTLAPLKPIKYQFYLNPYYVEDMTNINRPIPPEKAYPPAAWDKMKPEERERILQKPYGYTFFEFFIYGQHPSLPEYDLTYKGNEPKKCRMYMIDFKETFTISSKKITRDSTYPKIIQLTIASRGELRNKIATFYARIPDEDKVIN